MFDDGDDLTERVICPVCKKFVYRDRLKYHARMRTHEDDHFALLNQIVAEELAKFTETYDVDLERYENPPDQVIARGIMNSLQHGTPPNVGVNRITVGRGKQLNSINELIERCASSGESSALMVLGEYGMGKSHLLACSREIAFDNNCLVFQIDCSATSLESPSTFCEGLLRGIRFPDCLARKGRKEILLKLRLKAVEAEAVKNMEVEADEIIEPGTLAIYMQNVLEDADGLADPELKRYLQEPDRMVDLRLNVPINDILGFAGCMTSLAEDVGFFGCVFLIDELEEDRRLGTYGNMMEIIDMPPEKTVWLFFGNRDMLYADGSGVRDMHPALFLRILQMAVELSPLVIRDYFDLTGLVLFEFDLAYNTEFSKTTSKRQRATYAREHFSPNVKPREYLVALVGGLLNIHRKGGTDFSDLL